MFWVHLVGGVELETEGGEGGGWRDRLTSPSTKITT
jgi:hypothetical protein